MKRNDFQSDYASKDLVVAQASPSTWVVAISRRLIPGACFRTRGAALSYASLLANACGIGQGHVRVLN